MDELESAFHFFDKKKSGRITRAEFKQVMTNFGTKLTKAEVKGMEEVGGLHDNRIDYRKLLKTMVEERKSDLGF